MSEETKEYGDSVPATEIDDKIHKRFMKRIGYVRFGIGVIYFLTLVFSAGLIVSIIKHNLWGIIGFGFFALLTGLNGVWLHQDYRKIKKRQYPCYFCEAAEVITDQELRVKGNLNVCAMYDYKGQQGIMKDETVIVMPFDDKWFAFRLESEPCTK